MKVVSPTCRVGTAVTWTAQRTVGARSSVRPCSVIRCAARPASAARIAPSSTGCSTPNAAMTAVCPSSSMRPPKLRILSSSSSTVRVLSDRPSEPGATGQVDAEEADLARLRAHAHPHGRRGRRPGVGGGRRGGGAKRRRAGLGAPPRRAAGIARDSAAAARARRSAEPEARHPRAHRIARDAQRHRGPRDVPVGPDERGVEVLAHLLVPGQRIGRAPRRATAAADRFVMDRPSAAAVTIGASLSRTTRSRILPSSRTLPGQE